MTAARRGLERARPRPALRARAGARRADRPGRDARRPARRGSPPRAATSSASPRGRARAAHADRRAARPRRAGAARRRRGRAERERGAAGRGRRRRRARPGDRHAARRRAARARPVARASVDLAALAREVDGVEVRGPRRAAARPRASPDVVRRALAPLVENARRHARGRVVLELSARDGRVRARGPRRRARARPGARRARLRPRRARRRRAGDGAGLGLPLARRLARSCGGDVVARPGPGRLLRARAPRRRPPTDQVAVRSPGRTLGAMTTTAPRATGRALGRQMLNKVPEVTLFFWVIKIMCTTVGETAADYLNDNLGFGLTNTTYVAGRAAGGAARSCSSACAATCRSSTGRSSSSSASSAR